MSQTFFDLVQTSDFRDFVSKRIADKIDASYSFPDVFPMLYKYSSLNSYIVEDILNEKTTMSFIGEFNDLFDGAIHQYGTKEERQRIAENEWVKHEKTWNTLNLPRGFLQKEDYVNTQMEILETNSRLRFRELEYQGTYVGCFSEDYSSPLMWAHYADKNRGICIEYNVNHISNELIRKSFFPIAYSSKPIDVQDLLEDKKCERYQFSFDAALLCSALNKAQIWEYEKEWRMLFIYANPLKSEQKKRISPKWGLKPSKVYVGYHFLRPFFYHDLQNDEEKDTCRKAIINAMSLFSYLKAHNIPIALMAPNVGDFFYGSFDIPSETIFDFLAKKFKNNQPCSVRYYYTVHDELMDLIEKKKENNNA